MKRTSFILMCVVVFGLVAGAAASATSTITGMIWPQMQANIKANTDARLSTVGPEVNVALQEAMAAVIEHQTNRAKSELTAYINHKIEQISQHPDLMASMNDLQTKTTLFIAEEKLRIDADFVALLSGN